MDKIPIHYHNARRFEMKQNRMFSAVFIIISMFFLFSCGRSDQNAPIEDAPKMGRYLSEPAADTDGLTKILVYYDMEGISGQNIIRSLNFGTDEYNQARVWLTDDVNAVIEGLFEGGADEVHVVDAHGSGNPDPDILVDRMDGRAQLVSKDEPFDAYTALTEKGVYDAVAVLCMHSKTGGGGFAAHTYTTGMDWILNDMSINETEIIAYSWGRADVPVIFASGDDKLQEQLEWMDWLEYVKVKNAKGAGDAELMPFEEVHQNMREAAKRAVENVPGSKVAHLTLPIKAQLRAVHPARLDHLEGVPGINYKDQTVTFTAETFQVAYNGIEAFINVAQRGYMRVLLDVIRTQENAALILTKFPERLDAIWVDVESGTWKPPAAPEKKETQRKYFGYR
jgi:D-amino peptidase